VSSIGLITNLIVSLFFKQRPHLRTYNCSGRQTIL